MIRHDGDNNAFQENNAGIIQKLYSEVSHETINENLVHVQKKEKPEFKEPKIDNQELIQEHQEVVDEKLITLSDMEKDMISRVLAKHKGKRKFAAKELDISERTLYRKMKDYKLY